MALSLMIGMGGVLFDRLCLPGSTAWLIGTLMASVLPGGWAPATDDFPCVRRNGR